MAHFSDYYVYLEKHKTLTQRCPGNKSESDPESKMLKYKRPWQKWIWKATKKHLCVCVSADSERNVLRKHKKIKTYLKADSVYFHVGKSAKDEGNVARRSEKQATHLVFWRFQSTKHETCKKNSCSHFPVPCTTASQYKQQVCRRIETVASWYTGSNAWVLAERAGWYNTVPYCSGGKNKTKTKVKYDVIRLFYMIRPAILMLLHVELLDECVLVYLLVSRDMHMYVLSCKRQLITSLLALLRTRDWN